MFGPLTCGKVWKKVQNDRSIITVIAQQCATPLHKKEEYEEKKKEEEEEKKKKEDEE